MGRWRLRARRGRDGPQVVESVEMEAPLCEECREDKPHFFKIMTEGSAKRLRIPPAFLAHVEVSSRHAILKGPSNNIWHVEMKKTNHGTVFKKGWKRFRRDHCLEFGDFLVFRYDGDMQFSVQVFDRTACEKESAFHVRNSKRNVLQEECQFEVERQNSKQATPKAFTKLYNDASEHKKGAPHQFAQPGGGKGSTGNGETASRTAVRSHRRIIASQRRPVTEEERQRAYTAACSFQSNNPYCTVVMAPSYVYFGFFLHLPGSFRKKYLPTTVFELTLWDPSEKPWPVRFVSPNSSCGGLSGGWVAFTVHHNIEEGDVCVFELIKEKEMKVHIFRVVEEVVPLLRRRSNLTS